MADITKTLPTDRFGIKEVADVHFYDVPKIEGEETLEAFITALGTATPVISFDTLKVSNIESTAETSEARGGKGNAALISWDYGREVTVTLSSLVLMVEGVGLGVGSLEPMSVISIISPSSAPFSKELLPRLTIGC